MKMPMASMAAAGDDSRVDPRRPGVMHGLDVTIGERAERRAPDSARLRRVARVGDPDGVAGV